jgi:myb proto-oncogene protein
MNAVVKAEEGGGVQLNSMQEDLSKLLNNVIPSTMQVPDWYSDSGEISNGQSSGVTDENMGMDMQHIAASLFPLAATTDHGRTPGSCSWDNFPGIC